MLQYKAKQFPLVGHAHFSQDHEHLSDVLIYLLLRLPAVRLEDEPNISALLLKGFGCDST